MFKYLTVEEYLADRRQPLRDTGEALRTAVAAALPEAEDTLWHGHPTWKLGRIPVCSAKAYTRHLTFGVWQGARVDDPSGRLVPTGADQMASLKLRVPEDVDGELIARWLHQARDLMRAAR